MSLESWGRFPKINNSYCSFSTISKLKSCLKEKEKTIAYGNGRSYGDSALNNDLIYLKPYNFILDFDRENGIIHTQSGVLLSEIIELCLPYGWFPKIVPGTKLITVGGAIASDVHGKNHHIDGCFSECVTEFNLMLPDGKVVKCKRGDKLFHATCGGMGLTGIILDAKLKLKRVNSKFILQKTIKLKNLTELFENFEKFKNTTYSVAWIDCLARGKDIGRSILMLGEFANDYYLDYKEKKKLSVPFDFPSFTLNSYSVKAFNKLYYSFTKENLIEKKVEVDKFFFPLDSILKWNRIYGKNGFLQYQFILPKKNSFDGLNEILYEIAGEKKGSFLAVLKLYGKKNKNFLSFPMEGYSLALDFKIERGIFDLLDKLDKIVLKHGGRIYLAKDSRMKRDVFEKGYEMLGYFREIRKDYGMNEKFESLQSRRLGI